MLIKIWVVCLREWGKAWSTGQVLIKSCVCVCTPVCLGKGERNATVRADSWMFDFFKYFYSSSLFMYFLVIECVLISHVCFTSGRQLIVVQCKHS